MQCYGRATLLLEVIDSEVFVTMSVGYPIKEKTIHDETLTNVDVAPVNEWTQETTKPKHFTELEDKLRCSDRPGADRQAAGC